LRIATFNANSVRSRLDIITAWLGKHEPDVLCIQETKVQDPDFPAIAFSGIGYHAVFRGEKSYNGVAVLSRLKPDDVSFGLNDGEQPDETRLAYARFGRLHVVNTYVPQGRELDHPMYAYKLRWLKRLRSWFDRRFSPRMQVAWCGDMNVAREPADVHNPQEQSGHVCFHEDVRKAFAEVVDWGFVDVFRKHHPGPGAYSFFDYRMPGAVDRGLGWRVDLVMASKPLAKRSTACFIDLDPRRAERPSDHTFVVADFE